MPHTDDRSAKITSKTLEPAKNSNRDIAFKNPFRRALKGDVHNAEIIPFFHSEINT